jgi:esterase/lipase
MAPKCGREYRHFAALSQARFTGAQMPPIPPASHRTYLKATWQRAIAGVLAVVLLLTVVFLAGPRNNFGPKVPAPRTTIPPDVTQLESWLARSEAAFADIKPNNEKHITWAAAPGQRTAWSVVYLHGFSASRLETAPLTDLVAKALGANVFYTRLTGHGRSDAAMGDATVQDWLADAKEALAIGRRLGDKVLVISCSNGAALATWLEVHGDRQQIAGHVFVSPNFGPKDPRAELMNGPWGHQIAYAILGDNRVSVPPNAASGAAWSYSYPTKALFPMMALVKDVRDSDLNAFQSPLLALYSEQDQTVEPAQTKAAFARIGSTRKTLLAVDYSESPGQHVIAGDLRAPKATVPMAQTIIDWAKALP